MKRIMIVTDSIGLPRDGVPYEDTILNKFESWGSLWVMGGGGETVSSDYSRVANMTYYLRQNFFDAGIIMIGLVDCAPRPLPMTVRYIVSTLPEWFQEPVVKIIHFLRPVLVRIGLYQFTPIYPFKRTYELLLDACQKLCKRVVVIGICPVKADVDEHSPGLTKQIEVYNVVIEGLVKEHGFSFIDISDFPETYLTDDAHLNSEGHKRLGLLIDKTLPGVK